MFTVIYFFYLNFYGYKHIFKLQFTSKLKYYFRQPVKKITIISFLMVLYIYFKFKYLTLPLVIIFLFYLKIIDGRGGF